MIIGIDHTLYLLRHLPLQDERSMLHSLRLRILTDAVSALLSHRLTSGSKGRLK